MSNGTGWRGKKDLLSIRQLSRSEIEDILHYSLRLEPYSGKGKNLDICNDEILINAFFEPSTRTRISFDTAMVSMGGTFDQFIPEISSIKKGESIENTVKTLENYCDIIVTRHSEPGIVEKLASLVGVPVINAGDGINEHPTQTLLDLFTVLKHLNRLDGLKVATIGDLRYNRPAHSMNLALDKFDGIEIFGISPHGLEIQEEYKPKRNKYEEIVINMKNLDETLWKINPDIICTWRLRKEYIPKGEDTLGYSYMITKKTMSKLKEVGQLIVTHPMPFEEGAEEISPEIMNDPRIVPFKQERCGIQVRMAVIGLWLGHEDEIKVVGT